MASASQASCIIGSSLTHSFTGRPLPVSYLVLVRLRGCDQRRAVLVRTPQAGLRAGSAATTLLAMPGEIRRDEVRRLVDRGAQLVEVLPSPEYEEDHLPGAIHLPLRQIETRAVEVLDRERAVIVYCWDTA